MLTRCYSATYSQEHFADMVNYIENAARLIGAYPDGTKVYVMDGKVWHILAYKTDQLLQYDYFEYCDCLRSGEFRDFIPVPSFHLGHKE